MLKICNYLNSKNEKTINKAMLDLLFPIGKIEMFYDDNDHSKYCGFTWELCLKERSPIGVNPNSTEDRFKTSGQKFGEKNHILTSDEMPNHKHSLIFNNYKIEGGGGGSAIPFNISDKNKIGGDNAAVESFGGGQPHNNIHPVETVAFWKRVA